MYNNCDMDLLANVYHMVLVAIRILVPVAIRILVIFGLVGTSNVCILGLVSISPNL